jgi:hypothetical protein
MSIIRTRLGKHGDVRLSRVNGGPWIYIPVSELRLVADLLHDYADKAEVPAP